MPLDRRRPTLSRQSWAPNSEMFSREALSNDEGLQTACLHIQTASYTSGNPTSILNSAVSYLLTLDPYIFPLVISSDATLNQELLEALSSTFPNNAKDFMNSNAQNVLDCLKAFYISLPPTVDQGDTARLHFTLDKTAPALSVLSQTTFSTESMASPEPRSPVSPSVEEVDDIPFLVKKNRRKKSRAVSVVVDDGAFRDIGVRMPRGRDEAELLETDLLEERKDILKKYVAYLLRPALHQHARKLLAAKLAPISPTTLPERPPIKTKEVGKSTSPKALPQSPPPIGQLLSNPVQAIQHLEEDVGEFGSWKILLSGESMRHLRQIRRSDRHMFEIVKKKIRELSIGFFSSSNQKRLIGNDTEVPIYEAKMTGDTRLVYTIDCIPDASGERVTQAIKMFGVYTHAQINSRLWAAVAHWSSKRGPEYRKRCIARETSKQQGGYVIPISWPPMQETYETPDIGAVAQAEFSLELHALLTHEKFVALTQSVLDSIIADEESTHPFCVSHREHEVIYHPSSCFVVGRSGTGKTTTMLFKMLGIERTGRKLGGPKVRQVFITQSRVLAERVEEYFNSLLQSCAGDSQTAEEREWRAAKRKETEKSLMELDEEDDSTSNLPARFSQLEDKHFPLFLTFDKLCKLLEAEFIVADVEDKGDTSASMSIGKRYRLADAIDVDSTLEDATLTSAPGMRMHSSRNQRILYEDFRAKYWPHFPQHGVKGLDPALVWNEFQGVIRGSELSLRDPSGSLDRETYEGLSFRTQATFSRHRSRLYDVFEAYAKIKRERQEIDSADRTHALLRYLQDTPPLVTFDYMYVDEVQDNLLVDTRLLRSLCRNPHGLFWAGDTAQQITSTAFRFSDLKAFLHRIEEMDPFVQMQRRVAVHPKAFTLSINYRSHGGIINCAHSIVQLLTELWPDSIDVLDREQGLVDGPKPVFFTGWDDESVHYEQFLFGEVDNRIEFGAQQCILVRNDAARERLRQQIGDIGVIMTLYESKGLEFSDVLLYNFFEDSSVKGEWRVVLNGIEPEKRAGISVPAFNELRHVGVCSELKFLYVGLTRARNNLWIWDTSASAEPMKQFWESRGQIDTKRPGDRVPRLAATSTVEEWEKMGRILFARGNYQQAVLCFDRAELSLLRDISHCYHLRKQARLLEVGSARRKIAFIDVADRFLKCASGKHDQSQKCYVRAGECYAEAGKDNEASDSFCRAKEYTKGAQHARKAANFDRAAEIVQRYPVDKRVGTAIIGVCRVYFLRQEAFKKARSLFESEDDFLEHFDTLGFDKSPIFIQLGHYAEAAEIRLQDGKALDAIGLYLKSSSDSSMQKARTVLLEEWWRLLPVRATGGSNLSPTIQELSRLSDRMVRVNAQMVHAQWEDEIAIFQAIVKNDLSAILPISQRLLESKNVLSALRGFFHALREPQDIRALDIDQMRFHLHRLHLFGTHLRSILCMVESDFASSVNTQRLLGYRISGDSSLDESVLLSTSAINQRLAPDTGRIAVRVIRKTENGENVISVEDTGRIARELLVEDFQRIVQAHCTAALNARAFQPICIMNLTGKCQRLDCKYLHAPPDAMRETASKRFGLFLHHILVINNVDFLLKSRKHQLRRIWISRFLDVLYPQINNAGKLADIRASQAPHEAELVHQGLVVLREWIRDAFYGLNATYTTQTLELYLIASAVDHYGVPRYFLRAYPSMAKKLTSDCHRVGNDGEKHALVLDLYNALFAHDDGAMENGVGYIQHMIKARAHLDIHLLVSILETTTTRLLVGLKPKLHGLIMPMSWLFTLAQYQTWPSITMMAYLSHLMNPLISLVQDIEVGCEHLSVEGRPIRDVQPIKRTMLIRRVLRCLILAGCNTDSPIVRDTMIRAKIARLKGDGMPHPILPVNYIRAETWDDLAWAATQSSSTDAVVQLINKNDQAPVYAPSGVREHFFLDIPTLFLPFAASPLVAITSKSKLCVSAKEFVPQIMRSSDPKHKEASRDGGQTPIIVGRKTHRTPTAFLDGSKLEDPVTDREQEAARRIQIFYRQFSRRVQSQTTPNPVHHWFNECTTIIKSFQCSLKYRVVFLGPFPHFLVCLEAVRKEEERKKDHASKRARTVHQSDLEDAMEHLLEVMNSRRRFLTSFHDLKPSSTLHPFGSMDKLKKRVEEMCSRIRDYCMADPDIAENFRLAYKGIVQERVEKVITAPIKPIKPSLNTSDLFE